MSAKDVGIRIRVEKELRQAFQEACVAESRHVSDVLREFMKAYAERSSHGRQSSLFDTPSMSFTPSARAEGE